MFMSIEFPTWMWFAGGCLIVAGMSMVIWSLRGDRSRGRRRCPKCWYVMQGLPGMRCPECGREAKREHELLRPRRRWRFAALGMAVLLAAPSYFAYRQFHERGWYWLLPRYKTASDTTVAGWRVRLQKARDPDDIIGDRLLISRRGCPTFTLDGWRIQIGEISDPDRDGPRVGIGQDITGDGVPDLIVSDYSGGAHCCTTYHILSLGAWEVVTLQELDAGHAGAHFVDVDGDGLPEMRTMENAFAYWNGPFAGSSFPKVTLKWIDGRYQVAGDLMRADAPSDSELRKRAAAIRTNEYWLRQLAVDSSALPPADLWGEMIDLIYTGHADLAWQFFRDAWPDERPGRDMFLVDFIAQLTQCQYWEGVRAMNVPRGSPAAGMAMP